MSNNICSEIFLEKIVKYLIKQNFICPTYPDVYLGPYKNLRWSFFAFFIFDCSPFSSAMFGRVRNTPLALRKKSLYSEFFGPYFPALGLNTERYGVFLRIQSEYGKIRTRKTPNTDSFYTVRYS